MASKSVSPAVSWTETDKTVYTEQVGSSNAGFCGDFNYGPVNYVTPIQNESQLVTIFGKPSDDVDVYTSFISSKNFLDYASSLFVVRCGKAGQANASVTGAALVANIDDYEQNHSEGGNLVGEFCAKYPGALGNSLKVSMVDASTWSRPLTGQISVTNGSNVIRGTGTNFDDELVVGDIISTVINGNTVSAKIATITDLDTATVTSAYNFNDSFLSKSADSARFAKKITGTAEVTAASAVIVGTDTTFTDLTVGDKIALIVGGVEVVKAVTVITDDTHVTVASTYAASATGVEIYVTDYLTGVLTFTSGSPNVSGDALVGDADTVFTTELAVNDEIRGTFANGDTFRVVVSSITSNIALVLTDEIYLSVDYLTASAEWEYQYLFSAAPIDSNEAVEIGATGDGMHVVIVDEDGIVTGTAGQVLEQYENVFKSRNSTRFDGTSGYYATALKNSNYIWWMDHPTAVVGTGLAFGASLAVGTYKNLELPISVSLVGGSNGGDATDGEMIAGFDLFANDELFDIALLITGRVSANVQKHCITNIAERRMDCVAFVSCFDPVTGGPVVGDSIENHEKLKTWASVTLNTSSSYGFLDSGCAYFYDKYNDAYRWIPLNASMAGLCARTDSIAEPWFAPAGLNRGGVKGAIRLAVNPKKTVRDELWKKNINPVVSFPGQGIVLFGDKTMQARPSAFDAINVRRLFIILEKSIATAAKYFLFEQNDEITRQLFLNMVNPFLRDIKARRGIDDFLVDVGATVNTAQVLNAREFRGNIYVRPVGAIRNVALNFIATPYGVEFQEYTVA